jgi:hypothetical protein
MSEEQKEEYLQELRVLEDLLSQARTTAFRNLIIEEAEEIQAVFLRNRLEVPAFKTGVDY